MIFQAFMKIFSIIFLLICLFCGCGKQPQAIPPQADKLRILSLVTCADHIITELGAKDKIVAIDRHGKVLDSMQDVPVTVNGGMVSREMLRMYRINHAIIWYYQRNLLQLFKDEGISVTIIGPLTVDRYTDVVYELGTLCDKKTEAVKLVEKFKKSLPEKTLDNADKKSVYMELYAQWKSPAPQGYIDEILNYAGGKLAVSGQGKGIVSPEAVALAKPEIIFFVEGFGSAEELAAKTALRNTPAVKNKRIYAVPRRLVCEGVAPEELLNFLSSKISCF